jgi:hypothetical protein
MNNGAKEENKLMRHREVIQLLEELANLEELVIRVSKLERIVKQGFDSKTPVISDETNDL